MRPLEDSRAMFPYLWPELQLDEASGAADRGPYRDVFHCRYPRGRGHGGRRRCEFRSPAGRRGYRGTIPGWWL